MEESMKLQTNHGPTRPALARDTRGLTTVEYIIILVVVAVAGIGTWTTLGEKLVQQTTEATDALPTVR
jgi:Flp pilus assembly pilin Flp